MSSHLSSCLQGLCCCLLFVLVLPPSMFSLTYEVYQKKWHEWSKCFSKNIETRRGRRQPHLIFAPKIWIFIWFKGDKMNQPHKIKRISTLCSIFSKSMFVIHFVLLWNLLHEFLILNWSHYYLSCSRWIKNRTRSMTASE